MEALARRPQRTIRVRRQVAEEPEWACGWCKGFVHWVVLGGMHRLVHDEPPKTKHEVLPYRVS